MTRRSAGLLAVMLVLAGAGRANADLVVNGGFETGDFTGWTRAGNPGFTFVTTFNPNSGNFAAALGPVGSPGYLGQLLATTPGTAYTVSFALASDGLTPSMFQATFGGTTLLSLTDLPATSGYTTYTFSVTATSPLTPLTFAFRNDPGYLRLDDVQVNPTGGPAANPEPSGLALLGLGGAALAGCLCRRRKRAQPGLAG
jgi:hypothetical protein